MSLGTRLPQVLQPGVFEDGCTGVTGVGFLAFRGCLVVLACDTDPTGTDTLCPDGTPPPLRASWWPWGVGTSSQVCVL